MLVAVFYIQKIMEEVLKKHNLRFEIENEKNEGFLIQSKNTIFLEFDLTADDYDLIRKGNKKDVILIALKMQIKSDLDCICGDLHNEDTQNIAEYVRDCFSIYNDLLHCH